ncbi:hypothetical protein OROMI_010411 [Orobanche minor]
MIFTVGKYLLSLLLLSSSLLRTISSLDKHIHMSSSLSTSIKSNNCNYTVYVVNNILLPHHQNTPPEPEPEPEPDLSVHCMLGDQKHDYGFQSVALYKNAIFNFCTDPKTTMFLCTLAWNMKNITFRAYEVWHDDRCYRSGLCYYEARIDGIYFSGSYPPRNVTELFGW